MSLHEIELPETKPETEWVRGRALQKVSPTPNHAFLQAALTVALYPWSVGKGKIGPEWRFRLSPPGALVRPLVPDLAFVRNERLAGLSDEELQASRFAPDAAFEILSPGDRQADVEDKIAVYLAAGTALVVLVDPIARKATLIDPSTRRTLDESAPLEHPALPGFSLALASLFAALERPG